VYESRSVNSAERSSAFEIFELGVRWRSEMCSIENTFEDSLGQRARLLEVGRCKHCSLRGHLLGTPARKLGLWNLSLDRLAEEDQLFALGQEFQFVRGGSNL
jgi:hypothetical protein